MASHSDRWQSVRKPTDEAKNALHSLGEVGLFDRVRTPFDVLRIHSAISTGRERFLPRLHLRSPQAIGSAQCGRECFHASDASLVPGMVWCFRIRTDGSRFRVLSQDRFGQSLCAKAVTPKCLSKKSESRVPTGMRLFVLRRKGGRRQESQARRRRRKRKGNAQAPNNIVEGSGTTAPVGVIVGEKPPSCSQVWIPS
jgi:hypothetical protein